MKREHISIGELARRSDSKAPTIRYYEYAGLMPPARRGEGGQREYGDEDVKRLTFIRRSRELGFSVEEIRSLVDLSADRSRDCSEVDAIATEHLADTLAKIRSLEAMRDALTDLLEQCRRTTITECRVIDALSGTAGAAAN